jgi:hypothetical protein
MSFSWLSELIIQKDFILGVKASYYFIFLQPGEEERVDGRWRDREKEGKRGRGSMHMKMR